MEQLLRQLTREFRAFREQAEDRIKKLESNARIETPAPVVVADEPETPAIDPAANAGATQQTGAADVAGSTGPTGATRDTGATGDIGSTDPAADAKAKTAKGPGA